MGRRCSCNLMVQKRQRRVCEGFLVLEAYLLLCYRCKGGRDMRWP